MALSDAILDGLTGIVGAGQVLTKPEDVIPYGFDGTAALQQRPEAVVFPQSTRTSRAASSSRRANRFRSSRAGRARD